MTAGGTLVPGATDAQHFDAGVDLPSVGYSRQRIHILAEAERLCDQVSIIRGGRCVESGTMADLRHLGGIRRGPVPTGERVGPELEATSRRTRWST